MPWRGGLRGTMTWRTIPAGATAPGKVTHAGEVKGKTNLDHSLPRG